MAMGCSILERFEVKNRSKEQEKGALLHGTCIVAYVR